MSVYTENGFKNRQDYLNSLAEDYGEKVFFMADVLGPSEDFDGLITSLEDMDYEDFDE